MFSSCFLQIVRPISKSIKKIIVHVYRKKSMQKGFYKYKKINEDQVENGQYARAYK